MKLVYALGLAAIFFDAIGCGCGAGSGQGQVTPKPLSNADATVKIGETNTSAVRRMMQESGGSGIPRPGQAKPGEKYGIPK